MPSFDVILCHSYYRRFTGAGSSTRDFDMLAGSRTGRYRNLHSLAAGVLHTDVAGSDVLLSDRHFRCWGWWSGRHGHLHLITRRVPIWNNGLKHLARCLEGELSASNCFLCDSDLQLLKFACDSR